ncbi:hypothetical protein ES703_86196 [subsurface metagenome]
MVKKKSHIERVVLELTYDRMGIGTDISLRLTGKPCAVAYMIRLFREAIE